MKQKDFPSIESVQTLVFDFDGVFTDNKVYLNSEGQEWVCCDRRDGMGFLILKNFFKKKKLNTEVLVLSKEKNEVVLTRSKKLGLNCLHGVDDKYASMKSYFEEKKIDLNQGFREMIYLGNDLNDLEVMTKCGFSYAPQDAHPMIKEVASQVSEHNGGDQFIRNFIEKWIEIKKLDRNFLLDIISHR